MPSPRRRPLALTVLLALLLALVLAPFGRADEPGAPPEPAPEGEPTPGEEPPADPKPGDETPGDEMPGDEEEPPADDGEGTTTTAPPAPAAPWPRTCTPPTAATGEGWAPPTPDFPVPAGMVGIPATTACIGTDPEQIAKLVQGRPPNIVELFVFETPAYEAELPDYCIDTYEVTNAQYLVFLKDSVVTYDTTKGSLANIQEVAGYLIGLARDDWEKDEITWGLLYEANKEQLQEKMPEHVVKDANGTVDEVATKRGFRRATLHRGLQLRFYSARPPRDWPGMEPSEAQAKLPVRWVSYNDAERFAVWAGKHIPTEAEWEYAARGPFRFEYPWGNTWYADASHANWGAKIIGNDFRPMLVPVDAIPEGRSPFGLFHMLGNVAEWTSSWFTLYPKSTRTHGFLGEYVKVIRGGSLQDIDPLTLRLAARNFSASAPQAPPRPENSFEFTGFRCAWYPEPARDLYGPVLRRVQRPRVVKEEDIALERFAGAEATLFLPPGTETPDHVYVTGRSHAILAIPLRTLVDPEAKDPKIRKDKDLLKASAETTDPMAVAVFHTDVPLTGVWVRNPNPPEDERPTRRPRGPQPPPVMEGTCPEGTYLLAFWHERLAVVDPSLEFVCFLQPAGTKPTFEVKKIAPDEFPTTKVEVVPDADLAIVSFALPVGGKGTDEKLTLTVQAILHTEAGLLAGAGAWRAGESPKPTPEDEGPH